MIPVLLIACGSPPEPAPQRPLFADVVPEDPPCEPVACLPEALAAWQAGDPALAEVLLAARCQALPGDVACTLAGLAREQPALSEGCADGQIERCQVLCTRTREAAACTAAAEGWRDACEAGHGPSCLKRAEALQVSGAEPQIVNELLWVACDETDPVEPWACVRLADRVEAGHGRLPKTARGDVGWLRNQACDLQLDYACAPHRGW